MKLIGAVVAEKMMRNLSVNQSPAFSRNSVKHDCVLIRSGGSWEEYTISMYLIGPVVVENFNNVQISEKWKLFK
jgi:hypothetical protein